MKQSECLGVNQQGHLTIGGCDTVLLAKQYGTPLYVMDEEGNPRGVQKLPQLDRPLLQRQRDGLLCQQSLLLQEICRIMDAEQMGLDVVSEGELYQRWQRVSGERICFTVTIRPT